MENKSNTVAGIMVGEDGMRGSRVDDTFTDEMLDSSDTVLQKTLYGQKGLQGFSTPREASALISNVFGYVSAVDLTAGNGGMLQSFEPDLQFGIEIDPKMIEQSAYKSIKADIQKLMPLMERLGAKFNSIAINPPFGLQWNDSVYGSMNSTVMCYLYAHRLLYSGGQGVLIAGKEHFERQVRGCEHGDKFYAIIEVDDLFTNANIPSVIAFFTPHIFNDPDIWKASKDELADCLSRVMRSQDKVSYIKKYEGRNERYRLEMMFDALQLEYDRRYENKGRSSEFTVSEKSGKIRIGISAYEKIALAKESKLRDVQSLAGQIVEYFALNKREWSKLSAMEAEELITLDPALKRTVETMLLDTARKTIPLYPVKKTQRLGFLEDTERIMCIQDDPEKGYEQGETYEVNCRSRIENGQVVEQRMSKEGLPEDVTILKEWRYLAISIGHSTFTEDAKDIEYICEHFDLPDPGDVMTHFPEELTALMAVLQEVEDENQHEGQEPWKFRKFQIEDMARMLFKKVGLLSHKQGLGKTMEGLAFILAAFKLKAQKVALVIVPQDLVDQWQREAKRFFNLDLTVIRNIADAWKCKQFINNGGEGIFITYYEAISRNGRIFELFEPPLATPRQRNGGHSYQTKIADRIEGNIIYHKETTRKKKGKKLDTQTVTVKAGHKFSGGKVATVDKDYVLRRNWLKGHGAHNISDPNAGNAIWIEGEGYNERGYRNPGHEETVPESATVELATELFCPECNEPGQHGQWDYRRGICGACGYKHIARKCKAAYVHLTKCFAKGVMIIDEGTKMKGESLMSKSIRGLKARWRLLLTGTPAKNYIPDAFWLLWWSLGDSTVRFPFAYEGGWMKFAREFSVIECKLDAQGNRKSTKVAPEVTNLSVLWKLLCPSIIRRRKEDTGEPIVTMTTVPVKCPMGSRQAAMMKKWLNGFSTYFIEKYPDKPISKYPNLVDAMSAMLGLNWKMEFTAIKPESEPSGYFPRGTDWTPAMLEVLKLAHLHAQQGEKVLVGSSLKEVGPWIANQLNRAGIKAAHITTKSKKGELQTLSPKKRAGIIKGFNDDDTSVLCTTVEAMKLGHNLDRANIVIIYGLPWDYESFDQFIARVHRITSKKDVIVYIVMAEGTIIERKWDLVLKKGAAAQLAFDGDLFAPNEKPVSVQDVINDLIRSGVSTQGAIPEEQIQATWERDYVQFQAEPTDFFEASWETLTPEEQAPLQIAGDIDYASFLFDVVPQKKEVVFEPIKDVSNAEQTDMMDILLGIDLEEDDGQTETEYNACESSKGMVAERGEDQQDSKTGSVEETVQEDSLQHLRVPGLDNDSEGSGIRPKKESDLGDNVISVYTDEDALEDGIIYDITKIPVGFSTNEIQYATVGIMSLGYWEKDGVTLRVPNVIDLITQTNRIIKDFHLENPISKPMDWHYSGEIESPSGGKQIVYVERNSSETYTVLLPNER